MEEDNDELQITGEEYVPSQKINIKLEVYYKKQEVDYITKKDVFDDGKKFEYISRWSEGEARVTEIVQKPGVTAIYKGDTPTIVLEFLTKSEKYGVPSRLFVDEDLDLEDEDGRGALVSEWTTEKEKDLLESTHPPSELIEKKEIEFGDVVDIVRKLEYRDEK